MYRFITGLFIGALSIIALLFIVSGDIRAFKLIFIDIMGFVLDTAYKHMKTFMIVLAVVVGVPIGLVISKLIYERYNLEKKEKYLKAKAKEIANLEQKKLQEAKDIIKYAQTKSEAIKKIAKEEGYQEGFNAGYKEGKEKHKQELKALRNKISAVKSIFKTYPELNDCFKKITGWDFERWLKER